MIRLSGVSRRFGGRNAVEAVDLGIRDGEIFTLIGPSGSGKSTLLRLIDLLDRPTEGSLSIGDADAAGTEADRRGMRRRMAMVFQKPAMLNMTVLENVSFGLRVRGLPDHEARERAGAALGRVGLAGFGHRRAVTLSGGEMQRVAIARAIVTGPGILLLDEPTANLDPVSTRIIEDLIVAMNRENGTTIVIATHDMSQGQRLAHRVGVMMDGRIVQTGGIEEIFYRPVNRAIAAFVGIEPIRGGVVGLTEDGLATVAVGDLRIQAVTGRPPGSKVALCIRPEDITLTLPAPPCLSGSARNCLPCTIERLVPLGPSTRLVLSCAGVPIIAALTRKSAEELGLAAGGSVMAQFKATAVHVIPDE